MEADWVSAWSTLGAAGIALLAFIASLYAIVVARGAAKSAKKQASIAERQYRFEAEPQLDLALQVEQQHSRPGYVVVIKADRSAGPSNMRWRVTYEARILWAAHGADPEMSWGSTTLNNQGIEWNLLRRGLNQHQTYLPMDGRELKAVDMHVTVDMAEASITPVRFEENAVWRQSASLYWPFAATREIQ